MSDLPSLISFNIDAMQCAIVAGSRELHCMGKNEHGAVGDGTQVQSTKPTKVSSSGASGAWRDISAGGGHV